MAIESDLPVEFRRPEIPAVQKETTIYIAFLDVKRWKRKKMRKYGQCNQLDGN